MSNAPAPLSHAPLPFRKMHGLGNDFVVIDARKTGFVPAPAAIARMADRRFGVGCDQLIVLETSSIADARMRIFNPDASEVGACGNATRCIGQLLTQEKGSKTATIETMAGLLHATCEQNRMAVNMGLPSLDWRAIPLASQTETDSVMLSTSAMDPALPGWFSAVNMGNPHAIFFVEDLDAHDLPRIGPMLETHPIFPQKANISLAQVISNRCIRVKVWERAAGITLACGTAACATAVAAKRLGLVDDEVEIALPGGTILIRRDEAGHVIMMGDVATSFTGFMDPSLLEPSPA
jgi:diaminopimelate epimerase